MSNFFLEMTNEEKRRFKYDLPVENKSILKIAKKEMFVSEIEGDKHHPRILEYFQHTSYKAKTDETPWCAAFVCFVLSECGIPHTYSASSLSFLDWGNNVSERDLRRGDLVVFNWGNGKGHVGFVHAINPDGTLYVLGGNQKNSVSLKWFSTEKVAAYRRAKPVERKTIAKLAKQSRTIKSGVIGTTVATGAIVNDVVNKPDTISNITNYVEKGNDLSKALKWIQTNDTLVLGLVVIILLAYIIYSRIDDSRNKGR